MCLLKVLLNSNLVTCRDFFFFFFEKDVEKVGTPQKSISGKPLACNILYKNKKKQKNIYIIWPLLSLSLEVIEK